MGNFGLSLIVINKTANQGFQTLSARTRQQLSICNGGPGMGRGTEAGQRLITGFTSSEEKR